MNHELSLHFDIQADETQLLPYWQKRLPPSIVVTLTADADTEVTRVTVAQTVADSTKNSSEVTMAFLDELEMLHRWIAKSSRKSSLRVYVVRDGQEGSFDLTMPAETLSALGGLAIGLQWVVQ